MTMCTASCLDLSGGTLRMRVVVRMLTQNVIAECQDKKSLFQLNLHPCWQAAVLDCGIICHAIYISADVASYGI